MLVAVRQHRKEASALDSSIDLALKNRARAGQACGNDFSIFRHKVAQGVDVFVVDFLNASSCKTAKTLAFEQQGLGIALGALVFIETFWSGHDGLLKGGSVLNQLLVEKLEYEKRHFCCHAR